MDWQDETDFAAVLSPRLAAAPPDFALLWIHADGRKSLQWLLTQLVKHPVFIVHVVSGSAGDPRKRLQDVKAILGGSQNVRYVMVILGAMILPAETRWLTHEEISAGTMEAIRTGQDVVLGEIAAR